MYTVDYLSRYYDFHFKKSEKKVEKQKVLLLGDGFFARGFLKTGENCKQTSFIAPCESDPSLTSKVALQVRKDRTRIIDSD